MSIRTNVHHSVVVSIYTDAHVQCTSTGLVLQCTGVSSKYWCVVQGSFYDYFDSLIRPEKRAKKGFASVDAGAAGKLFMFLAPSIRFVLRRRSARRRHMCTSPNGLSLDKNHHDDNR